MSKLLLIISICFLSIIANNCYAQENTTHLDKVSMNKKSNLQSQHDSSKSLSVITLFKGEEGTTRSLQIKKDGLLPEHTTKTEALLICVSGEAIYEDENHNVQSLKAGDFYRIEPNVKHWVKGVQDSQLLLLK